jgi:hypothetical protein
MNRYTLLLVLLISSVFLGACSSQDATPVTDTPSQGSSGFQIFILIFNLLVGIGALLLICDTWLKVSRSSSYRNSDEVQERTSGVSQHGTSADSQKILRGIDDLRGILRSQRTAVQDNDALKNEIDKQKQKIAGYQEVTAEREKQIHGLKQRCEEYERDLQELDALRDQLSSLNAKLEESGRRLQKVIDQSASDKAAAERRYARLFSEVDGEIVLKKSVEDLDVASSKGDDDARAALAALIFMRAAEAGRVEEEALLSVLKQFSESYACYLKSTGCNPSQVVESLAQWASVLGGKFEGRAKLRVPSIGYPVEAHAMLAEVGVSKVSEVLSWCVYNSKDGVYAAARVR